MSDTTEALYAERDHEALGAYYLRHVDAMTGEGLHAKSAIAAELAWRDQQIASLQARLDAAERLLRGARDYVQGIVDEQRRDWGDRLMHRQRIDIDFLAEIDRHIAATQEAPASEGSQG